MINLCLKSLHINNMINKYFIVHKEERLNSIVEKILINGHRAVIVLEKNKVLGSISEGDILKSIMYKKSVNTTALNLMNKSFKFLIKKDDDKIKKIFKNHLVTLIPIVNTNMILKDLVTLEKFLKSLK